MYSIVFGTTACIGIWYVLLILKQKGKNMDFPFILMNLCFSQQRLKKYYAPNFAIHVYVDMLVNDKALVIPSILFSAINYRILNVSKVIL